jgi:hypothetical protein
MQFVKGKPPETQYASRPGACAKRREVALDRPGFENAGCVESYHITSFPPLNNTTVDHTVENV